MKTIACNRLDKFAPRFRNVRIYSLENCFTGETAKDDVYCIEWARKLDAKFQVDEASGKGRARVHSNLWYEFDVTEA